jgi:hypothetical protein
MQINNWRERTLSLLSESLGPVSGLLVDSAYEKLDPSTDPAQPYGYTCFLRALYSELPEDVDRKALCDALCRHVLGTVLPW